MDQCPSPTGILDLVTVPKNAFIKRFSYVIPPDLSTEYHARVSLGLTRIYAGSAWPKAKRLVGRIVFQSDFVVLVPAVKRALSQRYARMLQPIYISPSAGVLTTNDRATGS